MRKLIVSAQVSLDGVVEAPERWAAPFWDDPGAYRYALDELRGAGALLMGRRTYEAFLGYWPQAPDDDPMTTLMNQLPKHVASTTLSTPEWNATVIAEPATLRLTESRTLPSGVTVLFYATA